MRSGRLEAGANGFRGAVAGEKKARKEKDYEEVNRQDRRRRYQCAKHRCGMGLPTMTEGDVSPPGRAMRS